MRTLIRLVCVAALAGAALIIPTSSAHAYVPPNATYDWSGWQDGVPRDVGLGGCGFHLTRATVTNTATNPDQREAWAIGDVFWTQTPGARSCKIAAAVIYTCPVTFICRSPNSSTAYGPEADQFSGPAYWYKATPLPSSFGLSWGAVFRVSGQQFDPSDGLWHAWTSVITVHA